MRDFEQNERPSFKSRETEIGLFPLRTSAAPLSREAEKAIPFKKFDFAQARHIASKKDKERLSRYLQSDIPRKRMGDDYPFLLTKVPGRPRRKATQSQPAPPMQRRMFVSLQGERRRILAACTVSLPYVAVKSI